MTCVFSGRPVCAKYARASFTAVSMTSPPPDPKKTFDPGVGASAATRSASSIAGSFAL
jgi:hypothetical protein